MKQTAMQMAINHYKKLSEQGSNQAYVVAKFLEENFLEMENKQHQETFKQSRQAKIFEKDMPPVWESWEEYYNKTFKSE